MVATEAPLMVALPPVRASQDVEVDVVVSQWEDYPSPHRAQRFGTRLRDDE